MIDDDDAEYVPALVAFRLARAFPKLTPETLPMALKEARKSAAYTQANQGADKLTSSALDEIEDAVRYSQLGALMEQHQHSPAVAAVDHEKAMEGMSSTERMNYAREHKL